MNNPLTDPLISAEEVLTAAMSLTSSYEDPDMRRAFAILTRDILFPMESDNTMTEAVVVELLKAAARR